MPTATTIMKKGALRGAQPVLADDLTFKTVLVPEGPVAAGALELDGQAADPEDQANGATTRATTSGESTFTRSKGVAPTGASPKAVLSRYPATRRVTQADPQRAVSTRSKGIRAINVPHRIADLEALA